MIHFSDAQGPTVDLVVEMGSRVILGRLIYGGTARQSRSGADVAPWDQIADLDRL